MGVPLEPVAVVYRLLDQICSTRQLITTCQDHLHSLLGAVPCKFTRSQKYQSFYCNVRKYYVSCLIWDWAMPSNGDIA